MSEKQASCAKRECEVTQKDLPLCCPLPDQHLWDAHPRVYLPIAAEGRVVCPYCETRYTLKDFAQLQRSEVA